MEDYQSFLIRVLFSVLGFIFSGLCMENLLIHLRISSQETSQYSEKFLVMYDEFILKISRLGKYVTVFVIGYIFFSSASNLILWVAPSCINIVIVIGVVLVARINRGFFGKLVGYNK